MWAPTLKLLAFASFTPQYCRKKYCIVFSRASVRIASGAEFLGGPAGANFSRAVRPMKSLLNGLIDHNDRAVQGQLLEQCSESARRRLARPARDRLPLPERVEVVDGLQEKRAGGISIAYLVMAHRTFAPASVGRLLRVLFDPANLFLLHFDARCSNETVANLRERFNTRRNVHFMQARRPVGWGAFSMVEVLLEAMATAERSMDFDFFINLSDADVALRTHAELAAFLSRFRARSFVAVKFPDVDELRYHAHAHMRKQVWLEYAAPGASGRPHGGRRHPLPCPRPTGARASASWWSTARPPMSSRTSLDVAATRAPAPSCTADSRCADPRAPPAGTSFTGRRRGSARGWCCGEGGGEGEEAVVTVVCGAEATRARPADSPPPNDGSG